MLTQAQVDFFNEHGFLRLENVFSAQEISKLSDDLQYMMDTFAHWEGGWRGSWRKDYMEAEEDAKAVLVHIHELHHYSAAWMQAVTRPALADAIGQILDTDAVEVHHSTLHAKAPSAGTPFPMHQDDPFYPHTDGRYIDALVHVDNADEESGCLKFLDGSHKLGKLQHIMGPDIEPFLPVEQYPLEDSVSVPAKAGDVVLFHLWTVHGSALNRAKRWRRLVRVGYRDPRNIQLGGAALGRPGLMVKGVRPKLEGVTVDVYGNWQGNLAAAAVREG
ncbi:MAG: phytanoyl-CoA dioxygenase family protein [Anaerolineales bacterium]|nr:phytanoyl-CoA dioxygenase family protein [Anaerolineales bacterium]